LHNFSVAERVNELEKHAFSSSTSSLAGPNKMARLKMSSADASSLKAVQKQALLHFYERQQQQQHKASVWKSEPYLSPPPAPPRSAAVENWRRPEMVK